MLNRRDLLGALAWAPARRPNVPLLVRYPARFRPGTQPRQSVLSVDVAATLLSLAGVTPTTPFRGRPLWSTTHRDAVFPRMRQMGYQAVRTERWKYIHYVDRQNSDEVYDLRNDPYELNNLIQDRSVPLAKLKARLGELLAVV